MQIKDIVKIRVSAFLSGILLFLPLMASAACTGSYYAEGTYSAYSQGYYYSEGSYQTTFTISAAATSSFNIQGTLSKATGSFVIDDPLDPKNKLLYHSFVESPDVKNLYDGIVTLDKKGEAVVTLPNYFEALNQDFRYQLKPVGSPMPNLYVKSEIKGNKFTIGGGASGGRVSWQVTGNRHDAYIVANPIRVEVPKDSTTPVKQGEYLHPEVYSSTGFDSFRTIFAAILDYIRGEAK